ncbi:MAG: hypothetical protein DGJ47_001131 [Rickettsiaceae bacterium]
MKGKEGMINTNNIKSAITNTASNIKDSAVTKITDAGHGVVGWVSSTSSNVKNKFMDTIDAPIKIEADHLGSKFVSFVDSPLGVAAVAVTTVAVMSAAVPIAGLLASAAPWVGGSYVAFKGIGWYKSGTFSAASFIASETRDYVTDFITDEVDHSHDADEIDEIPGELVANFDSLEG